MQKVSIHTGKVMAEIKKYRPDLTDISLRASDSIVYFTARRNGAMFCETVMRDAFLTWNEATVVARLLHLIKAAP